jgi:hypothetical protein
LDFKPKLQVSVTVQGVTVEDEAVLKAAPLPSAAKIIGSWIDDERQSRLTIYRLANGRLYLEKIYSSGRKRGEDHELIELPSSDGRRFEDESPDSDREVLYFSIDNSGDLQTLFRDGLVWKAQAISLD